jgi:hypothetical protein
MPAGSAYWPKTGGEGIIHTSENMQYTAHTSEFTMA